MINGKEWTMANPRERVAFLMGIAAVISAQYQIQQSDSMSPQDIVEKMVARFANADLFDIIKQIDAWYALNEDQLNRPVIETIWFELVADPELPMS
ncbi:MAG: hypothetical protein ACFCBW_13000 [Candidatus Competibacterales bacterium]